MAKKVAAIPLPDTESNFSMFNWFRKSNNAIKEEEESLLAEEKKKEEEEKAKDADSAEMTDMITNIKNMTGLWDNDPPDSFWLKMDRLDHNSGIREPMGQLCFR